MGTSKSFNGPKGPQPLLPPWFDDPDDTPDVPPQKDPKTIPVPLNPSIPPSAWSDARSSFSRYVSSPSQSRLKNAAQSYVRASGGAKGATRSASSFRRSATKLLSFVSGISNNGVAKTLESLNLKDIIGKPAEYAISIIADALAPQGDTLEDVDARKAFIDTMSEMYLNFLANGESLEALENLSRADTEKIFLSYTSNYIFQRWLHLLGISLEKKSVSPAKAVKLEKEIKSFIRAQVKYDFSKVDILKMDDKQGFSIINDILKTAYECIQ